MEPSMLGPFAPIRDDKMQNIMLAANLLQGINSNMRQQAPQQVFMNPIPPAGASMALTPEQRYAGQQSYGQAVQGMQSQQQAAQDRWAQEQNAQRQQQQIQLQQQEGLWRAAQAQQEMEMGRATLGMEQKRFAREEMQPTPIGGGWGINAQRQRVSLEPTYTSSGALASPESPGLTGEMLALRQQKDENALRYPTINGEPLSVFSAKADAANAASEVELHRAQVDKLKLGEGDRILDHYDAQVGDKVIRVNTIQTPEGKLQTVNGEGNIVHNGVIPAKGVETVSYRDIFASSTNPNTGVSSMMPTPGDGVTLDKLAKVMSGGSEAKYNASIGEFLNDIQVLMNQAGMTKAEAIHDVAQTRSAAAWSMGLFALPVNPATGNFSMNLGEGK